MHTHTHQRTHPHTLVVQQLYSMTISLSPFEQQMYTQPLRRRMEMNIERWCFSLIDFHFLASIGCAHSRSFQGSACWRVNNATLTQQNNSLIVLFREWKHPDLNASARVHSGWLPWLPPKNSGVNNLCSVLYRVFLMRKSLILNNYSALSTSWLVKTKMEWCVSKKKQQKNKEPRCLHNRRRR